VSSDGTPEWSVCWTEAAGSRAENRVKIYSPYQEAVLATPGIGERAEGKRKDGKLVKDQKTKATNCKNEEGRPRKKGNRNENSNQTEGETGNLLSR